MKNRTGSKVWALCKPPKPGKLLRAYFIDLIRAQISELVPDRKFILWPSHNGGANVKGHVKSGRLTPDGSKYKLEEIGVEYFKSEKQAPQKCLYDDFFAAIISGDETKLPEGLVQTEMIELEGAVLFE